MNQVLLLIGLVCLASSAASTGLWSKLNPYQDKTNVDLTGLNKWLDTKLPNDNNVESNVAYLKDNLDTLKDRRLNRAARMVVDIVGATGCDEHLLASMRQLSLDKSSSFDMTRTSRAIHSVLELRLNELCAEFINGQVSSLFKGSLAGQLANFVQVVTLPDDEDETARSFSQRKSNILSVAPSEEYFFYTGNVNQHALDPTPALWANYLKYLSGADEANSIRDHKDKDQFVFMLNKRLVEPCQALTEVLGDTFEGLYGLAELQCSDDTDYGRFLWLMSSQVNRLLYGYKVCKSLQQNLDEKFIQAIFKSPDY